MKNDCPCKGCTDRKFLCHSQCDAYKGWSAEREARNIERYEKYEATYTTHPKKMGTIYKSMKRR